MKHILALILITFIPALELRASIPYGTLYEKQFHWVWVVVICVVANIVLGFLVFWLIEWIIKVMTLIKPVGKLWNWYVDRVQHRIQKAVEKYGEWGVAVFIGIPLPGSGVYSGALAAYLIGLPFRKFVVSNIVGVLIAAVIVTVVCLTGAETFSFFLKKM
ncbi:MAG TPA: small multi-drug export protein [Planctomycetota bacterium]|nr:small multi-drug export protein [Planctomycetota bacterium]